jgi:hypothetical protein
MSFPSDNNSVSANSLLHSLILYKPLRDSTRVTWPALPEGCSLAITSSCPEGYLDNDGAVLRRPAAGQPDINLEVSLRIAEAATGRTENLSLTLPLSAAYEGPVVNTRPADVAAAKDAYLKKKAGIFTHHVPRLTVRPFRRGSR